MKKEDKKDFKIKFGNQVYNDFGERLCMEENCSEKAEYKAPKNKTELRTYIWFCIKHIRIFNKEWNFFSDLSENEFNEKIKNAMTWERPSWKFGLNNYSRNVYNVGVDDIFGFLKEEKNTSKDDSSLKNKVICNEEEKAWKVFGIPYNSSKREIKKRYNQLAKRFHPDHNKNNPKAEELLKEINIAYSIINNSLCKDNIQ